MTHYENKKCEYPGCDLEGEYLEEVVAEENEDCPSDVLFCRKHLIALYKYNDLDPDERLLDYDPAGRDAEVPKIK